MHRTALIFLSFFGMLAAAYAQGPAAQPTSDKSYDLPRCLGTAMQYNFELRKAKENIEKQHGVLIQARSAFFPQVALNASASQIDERRLAPFGEGTFGYDKNWTYDVLATQTVFAGGQVIAGFKQQQYSEEAARREFEAVLNEMVLEVKRRFYQVLLTRAQQVVQEQNIELLEEEVSFETSKRDAGVASDFNVLRAEVALANGRTPLIRARNRAKLALEELKEVLGMHSQVEFRDTANIEVNGDLTFEPLEIELDAALDKAVKNRPDLKQLALQIKAAEEGVKVARATYLPALSAYGGWGMDKSQFSSKVTDELHGWRIGAQLNWSLFDGLATHGRIKEASSEKQLSQLAFEQAQLSVDVEVRRSHSSLLEARELVNASRKVAEQAAESLRLARARFDAGAATQLDVLDAQVKLTEARTNEVQALHDYSLARAALEKAMGMPAGIPRH